MPAIRQVAAYEPALFMDTSGRYTAWVNRFDKEMVGGQVGDALITSIRGRDLAPPAFRIVLRRLLVALTNAAMKKRRRAGRQRSRHDAQDRSDTAP